MKQKFRYVFVVLVYKNINVLRVFFESLVITDYKVIVVNSYYDDNSLQQCCTVANTYNADFIPIENKGFGYGNNEGVKYAIMHYDYDFLIMSNSDIQILDFSFLDGVHDFCGIIAPCVRMNTGKHQNPNLAWRMSVVYKLLYLSYKNDNIFIWDFAHILTRLNRELFQLYSFLFRKKFYRIYSCHGSFIIFSKQSIEKLIPIFNEKMFLYNEEYYLAEKCIEKGVPIIYDPKIKVLHFEGASTGHNKNIVFKNNKQSFMEFYKSMNWGK